MNKNGDLQVIFGSGPLGKAVLRELVKRGKPVRLVNRSGKADVPAGVEVLAADAYNPENTRAACAGASVVYQCAQPGYSQWVQKFPALQASILEGAAANGAKLVIGDNLYMYGEVDGPIHEGLPYNAHTRKGRVRAQMAEAALAAHQSGKVRVAIGRGSDFFGPEVLGSAMGDRVFLPALQGKAAQVLGNPDLPHTYTFIDDFGKALAVLGERDEALGQAWHVLNPPTVTTRQFITMIFQELGKPTKISSASRLMLSIAGLFIPDAREMVEMAYEFEKPFIVDNSKYIQFFGDGATPLGEAIHQTVAWYADNPNR